ncbi:SEL1-like repeat protein [Polyangium aurulentum]|uniref:SEL1-like repeat protein n=1 Tax=Polyangium aurulentum TaxID=2567896 RepID=UPI00146C8BF9|nr:SEL1-like repeat protein [Polyangium aurulentum]UQA57865.1 SEL1-like repeat protein [Polyangium aurulentum]
MLNDPAASTAACDRSVGTECYVIAGEAMSLNSSYADHLRFARRACEAYVQTCVHAIETLTVYHPERYGSPEVRAMRERIATEQAKRCAEGHPVCGQAALAHLELGHDLGEVRRYAEAGLEDKDQLANYVLGRLADEGLGGPADPAKAAELYQNCGDVEHADEHPCLGRLAAFYEAGRGVPKDLKRAYEYAMRAKRPGRATPSVLRFIRLLREQAPAPSREEVRKRAEMECSGMIDERCRLLWKLVEEGKPIPESLPER